MTTWPMWIEYCTKLSDLTIAYNSFSTVPVNALDNVANSLTRLNLYNNRLTHVPQAISVLTSLQVLTIQGNQITDLTWLPHNSTLDYLSLSNNYISNASHLSQALFPFNLSLHSLDTDHNLFTSLPDLSFLVNVQFFDFSHNKIQDSQTGNVNPDAFILNLSYNSLTSIPSLMSKLLSVSGFLLSYNNIKAMHETDFHSQVTSIDIGYNLITELTNSSFPDNFGLLYLYLNNNPLNTISTVALQRLPRLQNLNLQQTQLIRLPLALTYLTDIVLVDLTNCTALVCTCDESGLSTWVMGFRPDFIPGSCGTTSVYEFFSVLSQYCPIH
ncbi:unnamed protein product [Candidula unifasciata]|uniref:Uncharacterized protein n=1 Tax=Candidula unifasciata TaxID=100452 RepID=A0A8S3Z5A8_9EUPU|nr:unnamed protein product [Candidula unifasciata]